MVTAHEPKVGPRAGTDHVTSQAPDAGRVRLRLGIAYDGTDFSGWAAQPGRRTVEGMLTGALSTMLRTDGPVRLTVAGRTDAGVHARGQVAHVDVEERAYGSLPGRSSRTPSAAAVARLAGILPPDVVVHQVTPAVPGFDARFSALSRHYRYRLADALCPKDPLRRRDTVWLTDTLDTEAMNAACEPLLGLRDFAPFCRRREGATTIRTLLRFAWDRDPDGVVVGTVVADAFCHSMVRALVGAVVPVGTGRVDVVFPSAVLAGGVRDSRVTVMPAHGLCLEEVSYPPDEALALRAGQARARRTRSS